MENHLFTKILTFLLIGLIFLLCVIMVKPIIISIILALLTAYILYPIYLKIQKIVKEKNVAAFILIILFVFILIIPIWLFVPLLLKQGFQAYVDLQKIDIGAKVVELLSFLPSSHVLTTVASGINTLISKTFDSLLNELQSLIVNLPNLLLQFTVFIFIFYFAIRDSDKLLNYFYELSPFSDKTEKELTNEFRSITNAIVYGQVLIGVVQGLFLGLGLFILQVPNSLVLTLVSIIVSMIPILGSWFVWLPISIFLLVSGQVLSGVILILYGALFVSIIDNVLRFILLSKSSRLNIPLSVVGLVGGLYTFGVTGLLLGPLVISYVLVFISLYKEGKFQELFKNRG